MTEAPRTEILKSIEVFKQMAEEAGQALSEMADALVGVLRDGHRVYICGDGGSAAQAQHISGEMVGRFKIDRRPLPVFALTTDSSIITSVANDYDFERVFERQVDAFVGEGDILWCLSTSGNSANVLKAASLAKKRGARVIGFTGADGGLLKPLCDYLLRVPSRDTDKIQEGHLVALHILCGLVEQALAGGAAEPQGEKEQG